MMESLPQCTSRFLVAELGPEEGEQCVAADRPCDGLEREVREQCEAFRLGSSSCGVRTVIAREADAPEGEELGHEGPRVEPTASPCNSLKDRRYRVITPSRRSATTPARQRGRVRKPESAPAH